MAVDLNRFDSFYHEKTLAELVKTPLSLFLLSLMFKIPLILLIALAVGLTGCDPRRLPGFKREAKRQEELTTRETEAAINRSPTFQEINHLCTQEIPRPSDFLLVNKYMSLREEKFLGYGYRSALDFGSIKSFYITNLTERGWQLVRQKDGGWGPSEMEFRKEGFQVIISNTIGGEEIKYFVHCAKL